MSNLADRLKIAMAAQQGAKPSALARACGVKPPSVSDWLNGRTKNLEGANLLAASRFLKVDPDWLATGKGDMQPRFSGEFDANTSPAKLGYRPIPLINYVQAGVWTDVIDAFEPGQADEYLMTDLDLSGSAFALQIKGDSMLPEFKEGDRVIIDPDVAPSPGDCVVAKNGSQEATFKKYRPRTMDEHGNVIFELVPLNEDYPTLRSDVTRITIVGTMVEHRKYRKR